MISEATVSEEVFLDFRMFFTETVGEVAFARFVHLLPTTLKALFARDPVPGAQVPARLFTVLWAAVDLQVHHQFMDFATQWGQHFILAREKRFTADLSPTQLEKLPELWMRNRSTAILAVANRLQTGMDLLGEWFSPLALAVDERISPSNLSFNAHVRPVSLPLFCDVLAGFASGLLMIHHIPFLRIQETFCMTDGHLACSFQILFEPETPLSFL